MLWARVPLGDEEVSIGLWRLELGIAIISLFRAYWSIDLRILVGSAWTGSQVKQKEKGASCSWHQQSRHDDLIPSRAFCFHAYIPDTSFPKGTQISIG
jgi:hypothetical protein